MKKKISWLVLLTWGIVLMPVSEHLKAHTAFEEWTAVERIQAILTTLYGNDKPYCNYTDLVSCLIELDRQVEPNTELQQQTTDLITELEMLTMKIDQLATTDQDRNQTQGGSYHIAETIAPLLPHLKDILEKAEHHVRTTQTIAQPHLHPYTSQQAAPHPQQPVPTYQQHPAPGQQTTFYTQPHPQPWQQPIPPQSPYPSTTAQPQPSTIATIAKIAAGFSGAGLFLWIMRGFIKARFTSDIAHVTEEQNDIVSMLQEVKNASTNMKKTVQETTTLYQDEINNYHDSLKKLGEIEEKLKNERNALVSEETINKQIKNLIEDLYDELGLSIKQTQFKKGNKRSNSLNVDLKDEYIKVQKMYREIMNDMIKNTVLVNKICRHLKGLVAALMDIRYVTKKIEGNNKISNKTLADVINNQG